MGAGADANDRNGEGFRKGFCQPQGHALEEEQAGASVFQELGLINDGLGLGRVAPLHAIAPQTIDRLGG